MVHEPGADRVKLNFGFSFSILVSMVFFRKFYGNIGEVDFAPPPSGGALMGTCPCPLEVRLGPQSAFLILFPNEHLRTEDILEGPGFC